MKRENKKDEGPVFLHELAAEDAARTLFALVRWRFRELEESEHLTQQQLATRMAVPRSQVSRWFISPNNMTVRSAAKLLAAMGRKLVLSASDPLALQMSSEAPQVYSAVTSGGQNQQLRSMEHEVGIGNVIPFQPLWRVPTRPVFAALGSQRAAAADRQSVIEADAADLSAKRSSGEGNSDTPTAPSAPVEIGEFTVPQGAFRLLYDKPLVLVELSTDEPARLLFLDKGRYELQPSSKWQGAFEVVGLTDDQADEFLETYRRGSAKAGWV